MNRFASGASMAVLVASLTGCMAMGDPVEYSARLPGGEVVSAVVHDNAWPDWMIRTGGMKLDYVVAGPVTEKHRAVAAALEPFCQNVTRTAHPHPIVPILSDTVLSGTLAGVGVGLGSQAFKGTSFRRYWVYGFGAGAASGATTGTISDGSRKITFDNCGKESLGLYPDKYGNMRILSRSPSF